MLLLLEVEVEVEVLDLLHYLLHHLLLWLPHLSRPYPVLARRAALSRSMRT